MYLVADIGNTRLKLAVFDQDTIIFQQKVEKQQAKETIRKFLAKFDISAAILSNTSDVDEEMISDLNRVDCFIHMDHKTPVPVKNDYEAPLNLGKDRLAAAVGAWALFPLNQILFFDMGTCITMNFIDKNGHFKGGNISPGISMRLRAMHVFTDRLPLVSVDIPDEIIAKDTVKALQNGGIKGALREMDAFIEEIRANFGDIVIILTGGDAYLFEDYTKNKIFVAPNLVLQGLNEILKYNVKKN